MRKNRLVLQDCCIKGSDLSSQVVHDSAMFPNVHLLHCDSFEPLGSKTGKDK